MKRLLILALLALPMFAETQLDHAIKAAENAIAAANKANDNTAEALKLAEKWKAIAEQWHDMAMLAEIACPALRPIDPNVPLPEEKR